MREREKDEVDRFIKQKRKTREINAYAWSKKQNKKQNKSEKSRTVS